MIKIEIQTDNAAFSEGGGYEVARILRELATKIEGGHDGPIPLMDINGNRVGVARGQAC